MINRWYDTHSKDINIHSLVRNPYPERSLDDYSYKGRTYVLCRKRYIVRHKVYIQNVSVYASFWFRFLPYLSCACMF